MNIISSSAALWLISPVRLSLPVNPSTAQTPFFFVGAILDTLHSGVLTMSTVVATDSRIRAVEDTRLWSCACQVIQPDLTGPCRRTAVLRVRLGHSTPTHPKSRTSPSSRQGLSWNTYKPLLNSWDLQELVVKQALMNVHSYQINNRKSFSEINISTSFHFLATKCWFCVVLW